MNMMNFEMDKMMKRMMKHQLMMKRMMAEMEHRHEMESRKRRAKENMRKFREEVRGRNGRFVSKDEIKSDSDLFHSALNFDHKSNNKKLKKITIIREYDMGDDFVKTEDEIIVNNPKNKEVNTAEIIKNYLDNLDAGDVSEFENDKYTYERVGSEVNLKEFDCQSCDEDCCSEDICSEDCIPSDNDGDEIDKDNIAVKIYAHDDSDFTEEDMEELKDCIIDAVEEYTDFKAIDVKKKPKMHTNSAKDNLYKRGKKFHFNDKNKNRFNKDFDNKLNRSSYSKRRYHNKHNEDK